MPSDLAKKQWEFSKMVGRLITFAYEQPGYTISFGEAYRTPEQAALNARKGSGIINSLHTKRLAIDINLFIDGVYQSDSNSYKVLGDYWKSIGGSWGGDFKTRKDGNHFSLEHNGVR